MAEAASLELPFPETGTVTEGSLSEQTLALASDLPERPLVLGGCCCAHAGAVEGLAARYGRIAVVWLDAHGDLNTPESSPSGNAWGMPFRMLFESGAVTPEDAVLVGGRNLDPPEEAFIEASGLYRDKEGIEAALEGTEGAYVALDVDWLDAAEISVFMPEPSGPSLAEGEELLRELVGRTTLLGAGISGLRPDEANIAPVTRLCRALGL
jgi:arginase